MLLRPKAGFWDALLWSWRPESNREAGSGVVANLLLHWFPNRVTLRGMKLSYSMYLGTIAFVLFGVLTLSGVVLMFLYVPSVERAYWTVKDLEFAVSFGGVLRALHRVGAHLMVAVVFLHMFRVFLTGAYKSGRVAPSSRPFNWVLGVVLLVLTLLLSFTGYLLPWDQLAFWAITVGTNIAASVPLVGESIRQALLGGALIGQNTLIRFYVLHCIVLPLALVGVAAWHMWRIRKDGGLAVVEQVREEAQTRPPAVPKRTKTYSVLGIASGSTVQVSDPTTLNEDNSVPSTPFLTVRLLIVSLAVVAGALVLALAFAAPLEAPANPEVTPNPAKAPWYFLGLQELVGYSALVGGVVVPALVLLSLAAIPYIDREQKGIGFWFTDGAGRRWGIVGFVYGFVATVACLTLAILVPGREAFSGIESQLFFDAFNPATLLLLLFAVLYVAIWKKTGSTRYAMIGVFCAFIVAFVLLTYTGTALRGPNWQFYWPWQAWPAHPIRL
jgi:cytochrome b-561